MATSEGAPDAWLEVSPFAAEAKDEDKEQLFDLSIDPGERNDLRKKHPEVFEDTKKRYLAWDAQMLPRPATTD